jgi:hypothetical protein
LQDSPAPVFDLVAAVADDFVPPVEGGPGDIVSSIRDASGTISADFPNRLADKPDRKRSFADGNPAGVGAGMQVGRKPFVADDTQTVEKSADSTDNGDLSSGGSKHNGAFFSGNAFRLDPPSAHAGDLYSAERPNNYAELDPSTRLSNLLGWMRSVFAGSLRSA